MKTYKIIVYVPETHGDRMRDAMGKAGAGRIGKYSFCSFTTKGMGRFMPEKDATPAIGEVGRLEEVAEERIEMVCAEDRLRDVLEGIREAHPYEEPATDVYALESLQMDT